MGGKDDKGRKSRSYKEKKKKQPPPYRRPTNIHISEHRLDDVPARPSYSRSSHYSVSSLTHLGLLHGSTNTHFTPIVVPPPSQYYQTIASIHSFLPLSVVPSTSGHPRTHSDSAGSIGIKKLHLRGTPYSSSDPPTPVHSATLVPQPSDRDEYQRQYIIPYGIGFKANNRIAKITTKCVCQNFKGYWTNWQKVPEFDRNEIFKEFQINNFIICRKKLGRKVAFHEVFKETYVRKKNNTTDENVWVEPRVKATYTEGAKKNEEEIMIPMRMMKEQINYFLQSAQILPPCPGDVARIVKGLSPLDDYYTTEEDG
ncbi:hypothetical protein FXO37_24688 [Capsicum annuum]|nr:hypothetical protein FXO37_24688 [Capsicum annuum]